MVHEQVRKRSRDLTGDGSYSELTSGSEVKGKMAPLVNFCHS